MSSDKIECGYCNIKILRRNFDRHFESQSHLRIKQRRDNEFNDLRAWAKQKYIHNYIHLSREKIEEIKKQFKTSNANLKLFDKEKLIDIAEKLSVRDIDLVYR